MWGFLFFAVAAQASAPSVTVSLGGGDQLELSTHELGFYCGFSTGCTLWPAASTLARFLLASAGAGAADAVGGPPPLRRHAVLELGAGLGAVGAAVVRRGAAWRVAQTDIAPMLPLLRANAAKAAADAVRLNAAAAAAAAAAVVAAAATTTTATTTAAAAAAAATAAAGGGGARAGTAADVFEVQWGRPLQPAALAYLRAARRAGRPLLVVGSDLIVAESVVRPLVQTLSALAPARTLLALADRGDNNRRFLRVAEQCFSWAELHSERSGRGNTVHVYELKPLQRLGANNATGTGGPARGGSAGEPPCGGEAAFGEGLCMRPWWECAGSGGHGDGARAGGSSSSSGRDEL